MDNKNILLIVRDKSELDYIDTILNSNSFLVHSTNDLSQAIDLINILNPEIIIIDSFYHKRYSSEIKQIQQQVLEKGKSSIIYLTSKASEIDKIYNSEQIIDGFILRPINSVKLLKIVNSMHKKFTGVINNYEDKMEKLRGNISFAIPHEFRTSLNTILGYSNIIMNMTKKHNSFNKLIIDDINEMSSIIINSGQHLNRLTENFILYSQLQTFQDKPDKMELLNAHHFNNPKEVILDTIDTLGDTYSRKKDIVFEIDNADLQISFYYFHKIIYEIIENSLKFSSSGSSVFITASAAYEFYKITIIDNGRGMKKEQVESIGAYRQFDRTTHEQQGAGLGLIISKLLVLLHKGNFEINSIDHKGTKVIINIPLCDSLNENSKYFEIYQNEELIA